MGYLISSISLQEIRTCGKLKNVSLSLHVLKNISQKDVYCGLKLEKRVLEDALPSHPLLLFTYSFKFG